MEPTTWKEILEPQLYEQLVRQMRSPVLTFDERRYNQLLIELDIYRTQNYWETTRPLLQKKLAECATEEERAKLQATIDEFNQLSFQRVLYYQNPPRRTLEKDFSKYYDKRVKGWEEFKHIPPFTLPQYAVEEFVDRHGEEDPLATESDQSYYLQAEQEFPVTAEEEGYGKNSPPYLSCLNEQESAEEDLHEERQAAEVSDNANTVIQDVSERSFWYRWIPPQYRVYYDFLLFLKRQPSRKDLTTTLTVAAGMTFVSWFHVESARVFYYTTLGHLTLLSLLIIRGQPQVKKPNAYQQMMERLNPQAAWSKSTMRLGMIMTAAFASISTTAIFAGISWLPKLDWAAKLRWAYAMSILPAAWLSSKFAIFEPKAQNGQLFKSFQERVQSAKERQYFRRQKLDQDSVTLKLGQSISDFLDKDRIPIYQEYTYPVQPDEISHPSLKYVDQLEDEARRLLGKNYEPRLHYSEEFADDKTRRIAIQQERKELNLDAEEDRVARGVQMFLEKRAERSRRLQLKRGDLSKEELAQFLNVPEEALPDEDHEFPDWVVGLQKRNKLVKTRKTERYLSSKTKQKLRSVNRQSQQEAEELAKKERTIIDDKGKKQKVYIGEFGFRDQRPHWLIDLFGKEVSDRVTPIKKDVIGDAARKYGFYRIMHKRIDPKVQVQKADLQKVTGD